MSGDGRLRVFRRRGWKEDKIAKHLLACDQCMHARVCVYVDKQARVQVCVYVCMRALVGAYRSGHRFTRAFRTGALVLA